jgi:hypothetical protein
LQQELDEANNHLAQLRDQPPPVIDRKSPAPPPRRPVSPPSVSPPPPAAPSPRAVQKTEVFLPQYCPSLVREMNSNPSYLNRFRNDAKAQLRDELDQYEMGITEVRENDTDVGSVQILLIICCQKDTRLSSGEFPRAMELVNRTRQNIQNVSEHLTGTEPICLSCFATDASYSSLILGSEMLSKGEILLTSHFQ